jgi:hypothetical protein
MMVARKIVTNALPDRLDSSLLNLELREFIACQSGLCRRFLEPVLGHD